MPSQPAFAQFDADLRALRPVLRRWASRECGAQNAEDMVQETVAVALQILSRCARQRHFV